jgi:Ca2+/H+ antiporter, TMEM165/GDT1 family
VFWTGEGLGIDWPGQDIPLLVFATLFLGVGLATASTLRRPTMVIAR